jgi:quinol monooxygenase YgiN
MIIVMGEIRIEEGAHEAVREALHDMERETREEPGCLTYAFSLDINDSTLVRISERWESMVALKAHFATPHMAAFGTAIAKIQPSSLDVKAYDVAGEVELPR